MSTTLTLETFTRFYRRLTVKQVWFRRGRRRRHAVDERARALRTLTMSTGWIGDMRQSRRQD